MPPLTGEVNFPDQGCHSEPVLIWAYHSAIWGKPAETWLMNVIDILRGANTINRYIKIKLFPWKRNSFIFMYKHVLSLHAPINYIECACHKLTFIGS
jgi:hypothetical protein